MHKRIILCGKGASGKDHMRKKLESRGFKYAISYTTRPPREGEINGKDYFFISEDECDRMTQNGEWYEVVDFNGWHYGTTKIQFYGPDCPVFIMTPSGLLHVTQTDRLQSFIIYFNPPQDVIDERLRNRKMPGDSMERRKLADIEQFDGFIDYDIVITNPNF